MSYKIKRPGKAKNRRMKMAAKLWNLGVLYGKKARDYSIARPERLSVFPPKLSRIKLLQKTNYPHNLLWHNLCFKKRMPISISKSKKDYIAKICSGS